MELARRHVLLLLSISCFTVLATGDESTELQNANDKRYIAALAKNGRLPPKPNHRGEEKRDENESWIPDHDENLLPDGADPDVFYFNDEDSGSHESGTEKRYLGIFLKSRGRPQAFDEASLPDKRFVGAFYNSRGKPVVDESSEKDKRFVGAVFNSRGKPAIEETSEPDKRFVGAFYNSRGKPTVEDVSQSDKRFVGAFFNSRGKPEVQESDKRFVGAFFNSRGKPEVHEADKRFVGAVFNSRGKPELQEADKRFVGAFFNSRGKPVVDAEDDEDQSTGKRNIASLARKGWLSAMRSYRSPLAQRLSKPRRYPTYSDKRDDSLYSDEPRVITSDGEDCIESSEEEVDAVPLEKRNIAFLARNGMLPPRKSFSEFSLKRNRPAFLPSTSQYRWPLTVPKRLQSSQMRLVKLKPKRCPNPRDSKRNVAAMARKGLLPDKKSVASMARKGLLPAGPGN